MATESLVLGNTELWEQILNNKVKNVLHYESKFRKLGWEEDAPEVWRIVKTLLW